MKAMILSLAMAMFSLLSVQAHPNHGHHRGSHHHNAINTVDYFIGLEELSYELYLTHHQRALVRHYKAMSRHYRAMLRHRRMHPADRQFEYQRIALIENERIYNMLDDNQRRRFLRMYAQLPPRGRAYGPPNYRRNAPTGYGRGRGGDRDDFFEYDD